MNECYTNFTYFYKSLYQMYFQCMILVCETYKSCMNKFCMISLLSHEMLSLWCNTPYKKLNTTKIKDNQNANNKIPTKQ
jgi:hypothetical protein